MSAKAATRTFERREVHGSTDDNGLTGNGHDGRPAFVGAGSVDLAGGSARLVIYPASGLKKRSAADMDEFV